MHVGILAIGLLMQLPVEDSVDLPIPDDATPSFVELSASDDVVSYNEVIQYESSPATLPVEHCTTPGMAGTIAPQVEYLYGESAMEWDCGPTCRSFRESKHCHDVKPVGDLYPHYAYTASPKFYYYFRPYNEGQVRPLAHQAIMQGAHEKAPFSNALFQDVYREVEAKFTSTQAE